MTNIVALRAPQAPPEPDAEFMEFWSVYPRHEAMKDARTAYKSARKLVTAETLLAGARQHAEQYEPEYATLAHKWLRGERWNDEPVKGKGRPASPAGHSPRVDDEVQWRNRLIGYAKNKFWFAEMWGDPPGHPRCYAPAEILAEFGFR